MIGVYLANWIVVAHIPIYIVTGVIPDSRDANLGEKIATNQDRSYSYLIFYLNLETRHSIQ